MAVEQIHMRAASWHDRHLAKVRLLPRAALIVGAVTASGATVCFFGRGGRPSRLNTLSDYFFAFGLAA